MVSNVTSLLKIVKTVEDKTQQGTRALEAAIDAIGIEIKVRLKRFQCQRCVLFIPFSLLFRGFLLSELLYRFTISTRKRLSFRFSFKCDLFKTEL